MASVAERLSVTDVEFVAAAPLLIETEPAGGVLSTTTVTPFVIMNVLARRVGTVHTAACVVDVCDEVGVEGSGGGRRGDLEDSLLVPAAGWSGVSTHVIAPGGEVEIRQPSIPIVRCRRTHRFSRVTEAIAALAATVVLVPPFSVAVVRSRASVNLVVAMPEVSPVAVTR